jgi:hypothetical protein
MFLEREHLEFLAVLLDQAQQAYESQNMPEEAALAKYLTEEVLWCLEGDEEEVILH